MANNIRPVLKHEMIHPQQGKAEGCLNVPKNLFMKPINVEGLSFVPNDPSVNMKASKGIAVGTNDFSLEFYCSFYDSKYDSNLDSLFTPSLISYSKNSFIIRPTSSNTSTLIALLMPDYGESLIGRDVFNPIENKYKANHYVITREGKTFSMYANGVLKGEKVQTDLNDFGTFIYEIANSPDFRHGRIFNYALKQADVTNLYNNGNPSDYVVDESLKGSESFLSTNISYGNPNGVNFVKLSNNKATWNGISNGTNNNVLRTTFVLDKNYEFGVKYCAKVRIVGYSGTVWIKDGTTISTTSSPNEPYNDVIETYTHYFTKNTENEQQPVIQVQFRTVIDTEYNFTVELVSVEKCSLIAEYLPQNISSDKTTWIDSSGQGNDLTATKHEEIKFVYSEPERIDGAYLESTGTQWINTKFPYSSTNKMEIKFNSLTISVSAVPYGCRYTSIDSEDQFWCIKTEIDRIGIFAGNNRVSPRPQSDIVTFKFEPTAMYMDGTKLVDLTQPISKPTTHNIALFGLLDDQYGFRYGGNYRIYYYKFWDINNNLLLNMYPTIDPNGVACMYDSVSKTMFYNNGTGEFKYGITSDTSTQLWYKDINNKLQHEVTNNFSLDNVKDLLLYRKLNYELTEEEIKKLYNNGRVNDYKLTENEVEITSVRFVYGSENGVTDFTYGNKINPIATFYIKTNNSTSATYTCGFYMNKNAIVGKVYRAKIRVKNAWARIQTGTPYHINSFNEGKHIILDKPSDGIYTMDFIATRTTNFGFFLFDNAAGKNIDFEMEFISLTELNGCITEYLPSSLTHDVWFDTSGEGNHLENNFDISYQKPYQKVLIGSGLPIDIPDYIGQTYIDDINKRVYRSNGTESINNWKLITND